jgi:uridine phosphorylase
MLHHLGPVRSAATAAIVTGDPDRVPRLAEELGGAGETWSRRGYVCVEVTSGGPPVLVCSTGIGGPSTAIVVEELAQLGVTAVVRVGTCGSLRADVRAGDLVISSGSVRDEGTSHQYLPPEFPTVPDPELLSGLVAGARREGVPHHVGVTHCKDAYYVEKPAGFPLADSWRSRWAALRSAGVLATEMEAAALFAVAQARGSRAGAVFAAVDDTLTPERTLAVLGTAARIARVAMM